jgi:hypothetical protein
MIDISTEQLIPLRDVPRRLPARPNGRRVHISAIYRWTQRGTHGVRLECIHIGGTTYTSLEALQRFGNGLSTPGTQSSIKQSCNSRLRRRQIQEATRATNAILAGGKGGRTKT